MALQAFIDESQRHSSGHLVMAGGIASAEAWAAFSRDWEELLPRFGRFGTHNRRIFHMTEMQDLDIVRLFFRVMERHVPIFISARINLAELESARRRIYMVGGLIDWGGWGNPYFILFRCLMDKFHTSRKSMEEFIPISETVDFCFEDNDAYKKAVREAWDDYIQNRPDYLRSTYGVEPTFESPYRFLPLQGADLWAWWVRHWCDEGTPEKIQAQDFGSFKRTPVGRKRAIIDISFDEDQLIEGLKDVAITHAQFRQVIILPKLGRR